MQAEGYIQDLLLSSAILCIFANVNKKDNKRYIKRSKLVNSSQLFILALE